jgi:hypothetical protein
MPTPPVRTPLSPRSAVRLAAVTAALAFTWAAPAQAEWSAPFGLSSLSGQAEWTQVAIDPAGTATVVWSGDEGTTSMVQARRIAADGTLGPVLDVSEPGENAVYPRVAVDGAGNATVVWVRARLLDAETVRARRITAGGALEEIRDVSEEDVDLRDLPAVAVAPDGDATVVWSVEETTDFAVQGRRLAAGATPGAIEELGRAVDGVYGVDVAVDPSGEAAFAWAGDNGTVARVRVRAMDPDGALGPATVRSPVGEDARYPELALGPGGGAPALVWRRAPDGAIRLRRGAAAAQDVSAQGEGGFDQRVAVDAAGAVIVTWTRDLDWSVQARRLDAGGALGATERLSAPSDDHPAGEIALDGLGIATVVWRRAEGTSYVVEAARIAASGAGAVEDLSAPSQEVAMAHVAAGPGGNAVAVWVEHNGSRLAVAGARFTVPMTPPPSPSPPLPPVPTPAPTPPPVPATTCAPVAVGKLSGHTAGQPRARRSRAKGIGARVTVSRPGRVELLRATLSYRDRGKSRRTALRTATVTAATTRAVLRFRLRGRARRLATGRRVTLALRVRAGSAGCALGAARTLTLRTRVIWVREGAAL